MPFNIPAGSKIFKDAESYKKFFLYFIFIILVIDVLSVSYFRILDRFELVTLDFRYNLRLAFPQNINKDIAIIEIGDDTLRSLGKWPLPRDYHASLIDVLKMHGARQIIFDILFCEPSGWDDLLIRSTKMAGNVYFPIAFRLADKPRNGVMEAAAVDAPLIDGLSRAAKGVGHINKISDIDGKVRRAPLFIKYGDKIYPSLAFNAACDYMGIQRGAPNQREGKVKFGGDSIPIDENGLTLLNFAGRWPETFEHYSYLDILAASEDISEGRAPRMDLGKIKGKVCFVGLTATGTQELGPAPVESSYPMIGVHVNMFNMLTQKVFMRRLGREWNLAILVILALCLYLVILRVRPYLAFIISMGLILLLFIASILLFIFNGLWLDMAAPSLTLLAVYLYVTVRRYIGEVKVREKMEKELAVATSIQRCFLPAETASMAGLDIAADMRTAKEVGGDLYDFVKIDEKKLGIMIGDVSGKGVPAALFMAKVETLFRVYSKNESSPSSVISNLNREIASDERSGLFTTMIYSIFDMKERKLLICDAGHLPMILVGPKDGGMKKGPSTQKIQSEDGMAVGIMEDTAFSDKAVALSSGSVAVFYTDGVTEARDGRGNEFGIERLIGVVSGSKGLAAREIVGSILSAVALFQGKALQHDDITVIVVKSL